MICRHLKGAFSQSPEDAQNGLYESRRTRQSTASPCGVMDAQLRN
jgi:hypothetical protein